MATTINNTYAIQRVFKISMFDTGTNENLGVLKFLKQSTFTNNGEVVYADGGVGNPHIVGFDHSARAMLSCQNAIIDTIALGAQIGATPVTGTNVNLVYTDTVTITTNAGTTTKTALGTAGSEIKFAYLLNSDGSLGTRFTQAATPVTGKFSYNSGTKAITFFAGDIADGGQVVVYYNATAGSLSKTITRKTDVFSKTVKIVADTLVRDTCTNEDYEAQLIIYKAKINPTFELALTADGDPAVHNIEFESLQACGSTKLWDIIVYDIDDVT